MTASVFHLDSFLEALKADRFLFFRENGTACYPILEQAIKKLIPGKVLLINISPEVVVDYSFADETIGVLFDNLRRGELGDRFALIRVTTNNQMENIEASFVVRKQFGIIIQYSGDWKLVGQRPKGDRSRDELEETLQALIDHSELTASTFAQITGIAVTAANNRLFRLYEHWLAYREKDPTSREYVYYSLLSPKLLPPEALSTI